LRFKDVKNPGILLNVFNFYVRLDPKAGRYIQDIFRKNVSDYFKLKTEYLQMMNIEILRKEQELQNNKVN
jgi:hypothetical protein